MQEWHILVVEDDIHAQKVVSILLRHYDIQVDVAANAEQALELFQSHSYTAIIIDLSLPGISGWDLIKRIRADLVGKTIPCVAVTAFHSPSVAQQALNEGFTAYFSKPIDVTHFIDDLKPYLN
jgi:CheY-like chemotaxis protein